MVPVPMTLGERVALRRMELKMSQADLADRVGCRVGTISDIERGVTKHAWPQTLDNIATALDVELGWLIRDPVRPRGRAR